MTARPRLDRPKRRDRDTWRDTQGDAIATARLLEAPLTPLRVAARVLGDEHRRSSDVPGERERLSDEVARPQHEPRAAHGEARVQVAERVE